MNDPAVLPPEFALLNPEPFAWMTAGVLLTIGLTSLIAFLLRRRIGLRGVMALHLINLMTVLGGYFVLYSPRGVLHGTISVILLVSLFRVFSKFENTDKV